MQNLIIAEADNAKEVNPFPPRSAPKDGLAEESSYCLPPYHPRCRCNIITESSVVMSPAAMPNVGGVPIKPTDNALTKMFTQSILNSDAEDIRVVTNEMVGLSNGKLTDAVRALTKAEMNRTKQAFNTIPYELRKWATNNTEKYKIMALSRDSNVPSRVLGNVIQINEKFLGPKATPEVVMHELRHALINKAIIKNRSGAKGVESMWETLIYGKKYIERGTKTPLKMPIHVNNMYVANGGRGAMAASAAVDEYLAMIGDYYRPGMSMDDLIKRIRDIPVERKAGSFILNYEKAGR
jgi:hypothetical protein